MKAKGLASIRELAVPIIMTIFVISVLVILIIQDNKQILNTKAEVAERLGGAFTEQKKLFRDFLYTQYRHLAFLLDTPPVQGINRAQLNNGIDPNDGTSTDVWLSRLSSIFSSLASNYDNILQIRLIDANSGLELVRVDKVGQAIKRISLKKLQDKSNTDYFKKATKLPERSIYTSELNLNRENGTVEFPIKPTIRFSTPVYNNANKLFGILVINLSATTLLNELQNISANRNAQLALLDQHGNIIEHINEAYRFTKDLAPDLTWKKLFSAEFWYQNQLQLVKSPSSEQDLIAHFSDFKFAPSETGGANQVTFINSITEAHYKDILLDNRLASLGYFSVIFIIFVVISIILLFYIKKASQLRKTRIEFAAIIEGASDGIIAINNQSSIESFNRAATRFFPELNNMAVGLPLINIVDHPDDVFDSVKDDFITKASNNETNLRIRVSTISDEKGTKIGTALFIQDISEQVKYEQEIEQINASLEAQILERTAELEKARKNAVNVSNVKSKFVSTISHEMRTPLNGILGSLELIVKESHTPHVKSLLRMMDSSAHSLAALINDVLDLSKIEAGKLEISIDDCNAINLIEDTVIALSPQAVNKGIDMDLDVTQMDFISLRIDAARLTQILNNLIGNAIKFTSTGGVYISAMTTVIADRIRLTVTIEDTGIGIAKETLDSLFQSFVQANKSISSEFGGTGLGLSISKQLCELMGGEISVVSEQGKGSTFSFYLDCESINVQPMCKLAMLGNTSFQLLLCHPFLEQKWTNMVQLLGGSITNEQADYLLVDAHHPSYQWLKNDEKMLAKCIILSRHSESYSEIKDLFSFLNRPTKLISFLRLFTSDEIVLKALKPNTNSSNDVDINFPELANKTYLVADDNNINIEIACHLLKTVDAKTIVADSGVDAIEKLQKATKDNVTVDAILMDCQMPIMDGYEATRCIRNGDAGELYITTPIIALTANAMSDERDKCIAIGMNDYLTKPIDTMALFTVLNTLAAKNSTNQHSLTQNPDNVSNNTASLNKADALSRVLGNEVLYEKLINMFIDETPDKLSDLNTKIKTEDFEEVRKISHGLKGVSGNIGAVQFQTIMTNIEKLAQSGDLAACKDLADEAETEYKNITSLCSAS